MAGVSRQHLYKMADAGQISVGKELLPGKSGDNPRDYRQVIDVSELQRVFGPLKPDNAKPSAPDILALASELKAAQEMLHDREEQLRKAEEREAWLKKQIEETQNVIKLLGHSKSEQVSEPAPESEQEPILTVPKERYDAKIAEARQIIRTLRGELTAAQNRGFWARLFNR